MIDLLILVVLFQVEGSQGQLHDVDSSHIYHGELTGETFWQPILSIKMYYHYTTYQRTLAGHVKSVVQLVNVRRLEANKGKESFRSLERSGVGHSRTDKTGEQTLLVACSGLTAAARARPLYARAENTDVIFTQDRTPLFAPTPRDNLISRSSEYSARYCFSL